MKKIGLIVSLALLTVIGISTLDRTTFAAENAGPPQASTPVGAVIAFYLYPDEIKKLAPSWLPADGRLVTDNASPLAGRKLPDLQGKFVLAAQSASDVIAGPDNSQEDVNLQTNLEIKGTTAEVQSGDLRDQVGKRVAVHLPDLYLTPLSMRYLSLTTYTHSKQPRI